MCGWGGDNGGEDDGGERGEVKEGCSSEQFPSLGGSNNIFFSHLLEEL